MNRRNAIDPGTVQLVGDTALALARELGEADLSDLTRTDLTYFALVGWRVVVYGRRVSLGIAAAAFLGIALAFVLAGLGRGPTWTERFGGFLFVVVVTSLAAVAGWALWLGFDRVVTGFFGPQKSDILRVPFISHLSSLPASCRHPLDRLSNL